MNKSPTNCGQPSLPNKKNKFTQFLGIAWRAQALIAGEYPVLKALRAGRGSLLLLAWDASANTRDRLQRAALKSALPVLSTYSKVQLGHALGHSQRVAILVIERGFAKKLEELARE